MNVDTGELRLLRQGMRVPEGFKKVPNEFRDMAEKELGNKESVFLPPSHPLRISMTERVNKEAAKKKSRRKISKQSKKRNRRK